MYTTVVDHFLLLMLYQGGDSHISFFNHLLQLNLRIGPEEEKGFKLKVFVAVTLLA